MQTVLGDPQWWKRCKSIEAGTVTSSVSQTFGCGHTIHAQNGEVVYRTCPFCYLASQDKKE